MDITVNNIVVKHVQHVKSKELGDFINIYAPTGNQGERLRRILFTQELVPLIQSVNFPPTLVGDWNCIVRKQDTEGWRDGPTDGNGRKTCQHLKQLLDKFGYIDGF